MKTRLMTVKIRRTENLIVRPEAEAIDQKTYKFRDGWKITEDDSSIYVGEVAMIPHDEDYPIEAPSWISSGDLISIEECVS